MKQSSPVEALMYVAERPPTVFVEGRGDYLFDREGRRYLDFVQGWAVNTLGHSPAVLAEALSEQAATLISASPAFYTEPMLALAQRLVGHGALERVFFTNSGAEANEGAIKLARKWGQLHRGGAHRIVTTINGFHGRTLACMAASGKAGWESLFEPKVPGFPKVPYNDIEAMAAVLDESVVAVMLEPIQGEAGVIAADPGYLRELRALTRERGVLLILDEIQTGIGRTGTLFAHEQAGITPDIMTLGKGLGGGVPLAALTAREELCCFAPGDQGGTFNGNALACAAGVAVLDTVTAPGFLAGVRERGELLAARLRELAARHRLGEVRGSGLLWALALPRDEGPALVARAFAAGLLINAPRPNTLRFMPALNVSAESIEAMVERLDGVLAAGG